MTSSKNTSGEWLFRVSDFGDQQVQHDEERISVKSKPPQQLDEMTGGEKLPSLQTPLLDAILHASEANHRQFTVVSAETSEHEAVGRACKSVDRF